jgi:uncharacterized membrane protein
MRRSGEAGILASDMRAILLYRRSMLYFRRSQKLAGSGRGARGVEARQLSKTRMRLVSNVLLYVLSFGVAAYALVTYGFAPLGTAVHPDMQASFVAHPLGIYLHAFAAIAALALGPLQFSVRLRQQRKNLHRWLGRIYLGVGVLVGGVAGLYIAQFAFGGIVARLGFASLALLWLFTGLRAFLAIRRGAVAEHRRWMVRNFALTFAAVMLRLYLPLALAVGFDFAAAYAVIAWLCWVPNLLVAEWRWNRGQHTDSWAAVS